MIDSEPGSPDLNGMCILLVEDSLHLGVAMKSLLQACGANVLGPVPTAAEADRLVAERVPAAALVDIHLRGGERADGLIGRLSDRGVRVVVTTGDTGLMTAVGRAAAVLSKPFSEAQLFAALLPKAASAAKPGASVAAIA